MLRLELYTILARERQAELIERSHWIALLRERKRGSSQATRPVEHQGSTQASLKTGHGTTLAEARALDGKA